MCHNEKEGKRMERKYSLNKQGVHILETYSLDLSKLVSVKECITVVKEVRSAVESSPFPVQHLLNFVGLNKLIIHKLRKCYLLTNVRLSACIDLRHFMMCARSSHSSIHNR